MKPEDALERVAILGIDTASIIYFVENSPAFYTRCVPFFSAVGSGRVQAITSSLTFAETLVRPLRNNDIILAGLFRNLLSATAGLNALPVSTKLADKAADLRARYNLRTPDAVQLATAIDARCDAFLTNDSALRRVTEIRVIVLGELTD